MEPGAQISMMTHDETALVIPAVSVEVDAVDAAEAAALEAGREAAHPFTDEPRGVRRSLVRDPDGNAVRTLSHR